MFFIRNSIGFIMSKKSIIFRFWLLISLFFFGLCLNAQNLRIEGIGQGIGEKTIRLISIVDNLTGLEKEISSVTLNKDDSCFNFSLTIDNTSLIKIRIESFDYSFVAQKGASYKMRILPFNFNVSDTLNTLFYKIPLPVIIESSTDDKLNDKIFVIDSVIEKYLLENKTDVLIFRDKKSVNTLKNIVNSILDSNDSPYIKNYAYYSIGQIEYSSKTVNDRKLKTELFFNKPILYDNIGYMDCFELIYGNYFTEGNKTFSNRTLERWLEDNNYFSLIDSLGADTLLKNEVFRELVFLRGMKEAYFSQIYERFNVVSMVENFMYQTKFPQHKQIAKNLLELFAQKSYKGSRSKDFSLKDIYNNYITLDKYKDKPLIISFVKLNEPACLRELEMMYNFVDTLNNGYNFLTITCDRSLDALYNFLVNSKVGVKYKWDFAHFDNKWELLENYNINVFPTFVLLDEKGNIIQNPMRKPSEGSLIPFIPRK